MKDNKKTEFLTNLNLTELFSFNWLKRHQNINQYHSLKNQVLIIVHKNQSKSDFYLTINVNGDSIYHNNWTNNYYA